MSPCPSKPLLQGRQGKGAPASHSHLHWVSGGPVVNRVRPGSALGQGCGPHPHPAQPLDQPLQRLELPSHCTGPTRGHNSPGHLAVLGGPELLEPWSLGAMDPAPSASQSRGAVTPPEVEPRLVTGMAGHGVGGQAGRSCLSLSLLPAHPGPLL